MVDMLGPAARRKAVAKARSWIVPGALVALREYDDRLIAIDNRIRSLKEVQRNGLGDSTTTKEIFDLQADVKRLFVQRDTPDGAAAPGAVGMCIHKAGRDGLLELKLPSGGKTPSVHLSDCRRPTDEERAEYRNASQVREVKEREAAARKIQNEYEKQKQTWRVVVDTSRAERIDHERRPRVDSKRHMLMEMAKEAAKMDTLEGQIHLHKHADNAMRLTDVETSGKASLAATPALSLRSGVRMPV